MAGVIRSLIVTLEMIKIQHTLFALPFALLAAVTAAGGFPSATIVLWIIVAMVAARSSAMAFNRLVDAEIDRKNPRTASRAIPAGLLSRSYVALFVVVSSAVFIGAAWKLNRLAFLLAPVALAVILGYSLTKRFTSMSHLFLGLALGIAPVGAAIAVEGRFDPRMLSLAAAVMTWTAGFDILYSLQDVGFDRDEGLFSAPSRFGPRGAILLSRLLHVVTVLLLVFYGVLYDFGVLYYAGALIGAGLLVWQHSLVSADDISRIDAAFFTANGILSIVLFVLGACDTLLGFGGTLQSR